MNDSCYNNEPVTTALLLAAGTGSRLYPMTQNMPKCLTMVKGIPILERLVSCLNQHGFKRLVVVTGHLENRIRDFLGMRAGGMTIEYIFSPPYETTNNIYSLWMAREIIREPFLLVESDLVFDVSLLDDMLFPDKIAIARMEPWMNGSTVTVNQFQQVEAFGNGTARPSGEAKYKTVNIYSLSLSSWHRIAERLDRFISAGRVNDYYETVFAEMVADSSLSLQTVSFDNKPWYEIDTIEDLAKVERMFSADRYEITAPSSITLQPVGISRRLFQKPRDAEKGTVTISLSSLKPSSQRDSLRNMKQTHVPNTPGNEIEGKGISPGNRHGTA